jgi:hypothetical protein
MRRWSPCSPALRGDECRCVTRSDLRRLSRQVKGPHRDATVEVDAELHLLDTGHFALEDRGEQIAALMRDFLARKLPRASR